MTILQPHQPLQQYPTATSPSRPAGVSLDAMMAFAQSDAGEYARHAEVHRICDLPINYAMTAEEMEDFNRRHVLSRAYEDPVDPFRLWSTQCEGVNAFLKTGGLVGSIGVGWGKTLICIMCASLGFQLGHETMVLLLPSSVFGQFWKRDLRWARHRVPVSMPVTALVGKTSDQRRSLARQRRPGLYVMSWEQLSLPQGEDILNAIGPTLFIGDEAQNIKNFSSARTKRVRRYIESNSPRCVFVSGSLTSKSPKDYAHLMAWALGDGSCLPLSNSLASEWAPVIDSSADTSQGYNPVEGQQNTGSMLPLIEWARRNFPAYANLLTPTTAGFRLAYRLRFCTTPGVVSSGDKDIGTSLVVSNSPVKNYESSEGWEELKELMRQVEEDWITPNNDVIEYALHKWKWLYELSHGIWNRLYWPDYATLAARRNITDHEAYAIICASIVHHEALNEYHAILRKFIEDEARPGLDTPFNIGNAMNLSGDQHVPSDMYEAWLTAKNLEFEGMIRRDSEAIRVCPFKVNHAIRWCIDTEKQRKGKGALLWYYHQGLGNWLYEVALASGLDVIHCPAGENEAIADPANVDKIIVAPWSAHGVGKNLQHHEHQFVVQWPRNGGDAEQLLGRVHRNGQEADSVTVMTSQTLNWDFMQFSACALDALYTYQTTGVRWKMVFASYSPAPLMLPPAVLIEQGVYTRQLNAQQQALYTDKFLNSER